MAQPTYDFDEDEKNEPVGFEQDPDSDDFGDGYFTYADGTRKYASDPEQANQLSAAGKTTAPAAPGQGTANLTQPGADEPSPGADEEITDPGTRVSYPGDPNSPYANAVAANEGATGSAALGVQPPAGKPATAAPTAAERAQVAPTAAETAKLEGKKTPAVGDLQKPPGAVTPAVGNLQTPPSPITPLAAPMGAPAAPLPQTEARRGTSSQETASNTDTRHESQAENRSASGSVSRTGSAMNQAQFEAQQAGINQTYDAAIKGNQDAQGKLADLMAAHEAQMAQQGRDREVQTQAAIAQNEQRRNASIQKIKEIDSRPTDINKIWKDKGTLGTVLGALGVAMGSLYATKRGGPNTALQAIEKQRDDSIKVQLADRDSELRGMERELGSLDAAVPLYEARMNGALAQQAQAMLTGEKSQQVRANIADFVGQMNRERQAKLDEAGKAYYGTIATQQAGTIGSQRGVDTTHTGTRGSQVGTENQDVAGLGKAAEPKERTEDQAKAASVLTSFADVARARGLVRDKDGKWVPGGGAEADEETNKAAQDAAAHALAGVGYKPGDAEHTVSSGGTLSRLGYDAASILPFYSLLKDRPATPEELAKKLNAAEPVFRQRLDRQDRAGPAVGAAPASWR